VKDGYSTFEALSVDKPQGYDRIDVLEHGPTLTQDCRIYEEMELVD
jgi:hypothetical protein